MVGITTRGRYALRVMIDIAQQDEKYVLLADIMKRQQLTPAYTKVIVRTLSSGGLLGSKRGRGGGLCLARRPEEYTILEVMNCMGENLLLSPCADEGAAICPQWGHCRLTHMWNEATEMILAYLSQITLRDVMDETFDMEAVADRILAGQGDEFPADEPVSSHIDHIGPIGDVAEDSAVPLWDEAAGESSASLWAETAEENAEGHRAEREEAEAEEEPAFSRRFTKPV